MIEQLKPLLGKLASFSQQRMGFKNPPRLFLRNDSDNSQRALGKTAFYDPNQKSVTLFVHGRHPKDILRSFAHELVHHCQNERGDLSPDKMTSQGSNYAQECPHMRKMEQEAYLEGNMCFRDWEDTIEDKDLILIKLAESRFLKENKTMTTKITKEFLKETIRKILKEQEFAVSDMAAPSAQDTLDALKQGLAVNKAKAQKAKASAKSGKSKGMSRKAMVQKKLIDRHFGPELKLMDVQDSLLKLGYYGNVQPEDLERTVDDRWGPNTEEAIKRFQADIKPGKTQSPVDVDGLAGEDTLEALAHVIQVGSNALKSGRNVDAEALEDTFDKIPDGFKHKFKGMVGPNDVDPDVEFMKEEELEEAGCASHARNDDELEEGKQCCGMKGCPGPGEPHSGKYAIKEGEELEEADSNVKMVPKDEVSDDDEVVVPDGPGNLVGIKRESKIQTPEQENSLYENRFAPRNNRLFEKLVKEWTK